MADSGANIGTTQVVFEADTQSGDVALKNTANEFAKAGLAAEQAGKKVEGAGAAIDRTAKLQEQALEKARAAWQRELIAQDRATQSAQEAARAAELAALKNDILARSAVSAATATEGAGLRMQNSIGLLDNAIRGQKTRAFADIIRGLSTTGVVMAALPVAAAAAGIAILLGVVSEAAAKYREWRDEQERLKLSMEAFQASVQEVFNGMRDKLLEADISIDDMAGKHLDALQKRLELIDHQTLDDLRGEFDKLSEAADKFLAQKDLLTAWYQPGIGSAGASHALEVFTKGYNLDLTLGKTGDAAALLSSTLGIAQKVLDLEQRISTTPKYLTEPGVGLEANPAWINLSQQLQSYGLSGTAKELQAQQVFVETLQDQQRVAQGFSDLSEKNKKAAKMQDAEANAREAAEMAKFLHPEMNERMKALVGEPGTLRGYTREEFARLKRGAQEHMQAEEGAPPTSDRSVTVEMQEDITRMGERWKGFNQAVLEGQEAQAKFRQQMGLTEVQLNLNSGAISRHEALTRQLAIEAGAYRQEQFNIGLRMSQVQGDTGLTEPQRAEQLQQLQNQLDAAKNAYELKQAEMEAQARSVTALGELHDRSMQLAQDWTDMGRQISDVIIRGLEDFNRTLMRTMSTPQSMLRGQHPWRNLGAGVAESAGTAALQYGEGTLMKWLLGRNPNAKLGTKDNPMYTRDADRPGGGATGSPSGLMGSLLGWANNSDTMGQLFGGKLFGPGGIFDSQGGGSGSLSGFSSLFGPKNGSGGTPNGTQSNPFWVKSADSGGSDSDSGISGLFGGGDMTSGIGAGLGSLGGLLGGLGGSAAGAGAGLGGLAAGLAGFASGGMIPSNLPVLVGENGPEILAGARGRTVIPNDRIGGSTVHQHFNFNINGGDPAATKAMIHKTMAGYLPTLSKMGKASIADHNRRVPPSRRI